MRSYYSNTVGNFQNDTLNSILGSLCRNHSFSVEELQKNAWIEQVQLLQQTLVDFPDARLMFEYAIPRMGKRVDNILLYRGIIFVIEFKVGDTAYHAHAIDQVMDYATDLKNFHAGSHDRLIIPILVATKASGLSQTISIGRDRVSEVVRCNRQSLRNAISHIAATHAQPEIDALAWENALYKPTPTIIEAAQALYRGHDVSEISRSDGGAINLSKTAQAINEIIEHSKSGNRKSICFVTGVPGAGKTLAGLNIANERHKFDEDEHAVFLSGNGPLVDVLQEALARNEAEHSGIKKDEARQKAKAFIQAIHHFRDDALSVPTPPVEKVVVFDEAQRAWTLEQTSNFMKSKKGILNFNQSEPNFLISIMDRHQDWATIICLVGGGQEINKGEAGLPEWFSALRTNYPDWDVYVSQEITQQEYTRGEQVQHMVAGLNVTYVDDLHLSTSIRSFRSENVSNFVKALLDNQIHTAKSIFAEFTDKYPIVVTRDLAQARQWLREQARGTERIGVIASSGAMRLKPYGLCTQIKIDACNWFLNDKEDVRSSYYLEDVASEFDVQGLELDWTCVAWDANLRYNNGWIYKQFKGTKWLNTNKEEVVLYLKNAYRVLLTRARQGMVLFVPEGSAQDPTRLPEFYDGLYQLLTTQIGIPKI